MSLGIRLLENVLSSVVRNTVPISDTDIGVFRYPSFYDISRNNNYKRVIIDLYNKAIVREDL